VKGRFLVFLVLGVLAAGLGYLAQQALIGRPAAVLPEPLLVDLDGGAHHLDEFKGKVLVLNFWATWCQPCRSEMKTFSDLQVRLGGRGVQFIGVALDDPAIVRDYLRDFPVTYPIWVGGADIPAWADSLGNELSALPFTVVFDRNGEKRQVKVGIYEEGPLLKVIEALLPKGN
jgi:thiol-disulfide isomerase/thioredoxin